MTPLHMSWRCQSNNSIAYISNVNNGVAKEEFPIQLFLTVED